MGYIDSHIFRTVAENNLDSESAAIIGNVIKQMTNFSVSSIEEGYEIPSGSNTWKVLVKLESGNYFIAELPELKKLVGTPQQIAGWPLSSSYLESLATFIAFIHEDERIKIEFILDLLRPFNMKANIAAILKKAQRQLSYRQYILTTGNPTAAKVQRALEDQVAKHVGQGD